MRLINTTTYRLEEHIDPRPYAILSHTWRGDEEVLFDEFSDPACRNKTGYIKLEYLCTEARKNGLGYAWIDTVCINKSSSAELSEAINSMFAWYQSAAICYVYLDDAREVADIEHCHWLTRGWTLQELLAPRAVHFFGINWVPLGTKSSLIANLVRWTRIDQICLLHPSSIRYSSAATRMRWAAGRKTTRIEDKAYCLMGIFGINMPLLYGEGSQAFRRLQEEVVRQTGGISIIAFDRGTCADDEPNLFATSPDAFLMRPRIIRAPGTPGEWLNRGVKLKVVLLEAPNHYLGILPYRFEFDIEQLIAIPLAKKSYGEGYVILDQSLLSVNADLALQHEEQEILILEQSLMGDEYLDHEDSRHICAISADTFVANGFEIIYAEPESGIDSWNSRQLTSEVVTYAPFLIRKFGFWSHPHQEAFLIGLAVVKTGQYYRHFICFRVSPNPVAILTWFKEQGILGTIQQPDPNDDRWKLLRYCAEHDIDDDHWILVNDPHWGEDQPYSATFHLSERWPNGVALEVSFENIMGCKISLEPVTAQRQKAQFSG